MLAAGEGIQCWIFEQVYRVEWVTIMTVEQLLSVVVLREDLHRTSSSTKCHDASMMQHRYVSRRRSENSKRLTD